MIDFTRICEHRNGPACAETLRLMPDNFCPLAFHSVYAYLLTLSENGWFNWVNHPDHVIVHCPRPDGIAMRVKKSNAPGILDVEILLQEGGCFKGYQPGQKFVFDLTRDKKTLFAQADKIISFAAPILPRKREE